MEQIQLEEYNVEGMKSTENQSTTYPQLMYLYNHS